jgi:hypothetical protein
VDIPLFLPAFVVGIASGFYFRDRILRVRESRYLTEPELFQRAPRRENVVPSDNPELSSPSQEIDRALAASLSPQPALIVD